MWINYHAYFMNKIHVTIAYLQPVNFRHIEATYMQTLSQHWSLPIFSSDT